MEEWRIRVIKVNPEMKILHVELATPLRPLQLVSLGSSAVSVIADAGVPPILCISGRMPIWAYAAVLHELLHLVPVLAVFDPKLRSCVVVSSHHSEYIVGQQLPIPEEFLKELLSPSPTGQQQR